MQQENIDPYALFDWGPGVDHIIDRLFVAPMNTAYPPLPSMVVTTGTREEMEALKKLMKAAHGNNG